MRIIYIALLIALCGNAHGMTGNELSSQCAGFTMAVDGIEPSLRGVKGLMCLAYITGVYDMYMEAAPYSSLLTPICVPAGATNGQMTSVVKKYLVNHPEDLHRYATSLSILALQDAFPCIPQE